MSRSIREVLGMGQLLLALLTATSPAGAQQKVDHIPATPQTENPWQWSWDANVFVGWNYQYRKFTDFQENESQNWFMGAGERRVGQGRLRVSMRRRAADVAEQLRLGQRLAAAVPNTS